MSRGLAFFQDRGHLSPFSGVQTVLERWLIWPALVASALAVQGCASTPERADQAKPSNPAKAGPLEIQARAFENVEDYVLGPGDILAITVWDVEKVNQESHFESEVSSDGHIVLPLVGSIDTTGTTVPKLRAQIEKSYASYVIEPNVSVSVKEYRSRRILITGFVAKQDVYFLKQNRVTLLEALSLAGGLGAEGGTRVYVTPPPTRGDDGAMHLPPPTVIDLIPLVEGGALASNISIEPGSAIYVPRAEEFYVMGYAFKPGAYLIQRPTGIVRAIAIAGGLDVRKASPSQVEIHRADGNTVLHVDINEIARGEAPDVPVYANDTIKCGRTWPWAIYSEIVDTALGGFFSAIGFFFATR